MKHVGLNVALDPLMTFAYLGANGGLVVVSADDPGMHSSQNEQDNRNLAKFARIPMLEPSDSQECCDMTRAALEISEEFHLPVLLRTTTRVSHSSTVVDLGAFERAGRGDRVYDKDITKTVPVPMFARKMRVNLEEKLGGFGRAFREEPVPEGGTGRPDRDHHLRNRLSVRARSFPRGVDTQAGHDLSLARRL